MSHVDRAVTLLVEAAALLLLVALIGAAITFQPYPPSGPSTPSVPASPLVDPGVARSLPSPPPGLSEADILRDEARHEEYLEDEAREDEASRPEYECNC